MSGLTRGLVQLACLVLLLWGGASVRAQQVVRPPASRANPAAPKVVRGNAAVTVNVQPASPVVTYGYANSVYFWRPYGNGYVPAYGSTVVSPYVPPYYGGNPYNYPTFGSTTPVSGPYGTFGIPSYNYDYYGGSMGGYGTMTPGLTIGVGNAGYGPWTYVGPVY